MPTARQFLLQALLWALVAWLVSALWALKAPGVEVAEALTRYYSLRAPVAGALTGLVFTPLLCMGNLPGRASALAHRSRGLAVERPTRLLLRTLQGAVLGQVVGASATALLLLMWPNENWNTRWDALKWAAFFWKTDWYIFIPSGVLFGGLAVWVGTFGVRRRPDPVVHGDR